MSTANRPTTKPSAFPKIIAGPASYANGVKANVLFFDADLEDLPDPDVLAEQIIENLEAGLNSFRDVLSALQS